MATIKLQPSGKVVLKDGKVACGCCCGCGISIPQELREIVANATIDSVTMYGYSPIDFEADVVAPNTWTALWASEPEPLYVAELTYYIDTGCLVRSGFYIEWVQEYPEPGEVIISGVGSIGTPESCEDLNFPTATGTFTINGEGEFPYYYFTGLNESIGENYLFVPPPDLIFT